MTRDKVWIKVQHAIGFRKEAMCRVLKAENYDVYIDTKRLKEFGDLTDCKFYGSGHNNPVHIIDTYTSRLVGIILPVK